MSAPGDRLRFATAPSGRVGDAHDVMISPAFVGLARELATTLGIDPAVVRDSSFVNSRCP